MTLDDERDQDFPLRLPPSMLLRAYEIAHREKLSLNQFIGLAIAEKISRLEQGQILASNQQLSHLIASVSRQKATEDTDPQNKPRASDPGTTNPTLTRKGAKRSRIDRRSKPSEQA